jgi:hypothetical protein
VLATARDRIHVQFSPAQQGAARIAVNAQSTLTPSQWVRLIDRLGQIPNPTVHAGHSSAAIPDPASAATGGSANGNG